VQSRVGHVLVLLHLAGIVEDPEVAFIGKRVLFAARDVRYIERDQREDFVALREERVRLDLYHLLQALANGGFLWGSGIRYVLAQGFRPAQGAMQPALRAT